MFSASIYKNSNAMVKPGNIIPTNGTKIDGKYDAVMCIFLFLMTN